MKKGRGQGGGPKISTRKKVGRKTEGERAVEKQAAQIARRAATLKRRPAVAGGRQRDRFVEQCEDGAAKHAVFARPTGDRDWVEIGHVTAVGQVSPEQSARLQKRLILEWAVRLHKPLQPQAEILECGIVLDTTEEDAEPTMLEAADEEEARLLVQAPRYVAASCGFLGHPLPGGHYYGDNSQVGDGLDDNTKVKWSKLGNNAKSAIQEQTSKTLGLRSLG